MEQSFHNVLSVTQATPQRKEGRDGSSYYTSHLQIKFESFGMVLRFRIQLFSQDDNAVQLMPRYDDEEANTLSGN